MNKKVRYIIFSVLSAIFLVAIDLLLIAGYFDFNQFGYTTNRPWLSLVSFLFFFTPVIPLGFFLFYGGKIGLTVAKMFVGFVAITILLFTFPVFLFFTYEPDIHTKIPAFVVSGMWAATATVFLFFQLLSGLVFLKLRKKALGTTIPQKFFKTYIYSLSVYLVLPVLLIVIILANGNSSNNRLCSNANYAEGRFSRVYFLEPIIKSEVTKIAKENNFKIDHIMLASKGDIDNPLDSWIYPPLDLLTTEQKLELSFKEFQAMSEPLRNQYLSLFQAYEAGEPIVWALGFKDVPMDTMTKFVYRLDVEERRLGAVDGAFADNPRDIRPVTDRLVVDQAECYRKLKLKAR